MTIVATFPNFIKKASTFDIGDSTIFSGPGIQIVSVIITKVVSVLLRNRYLIAIESLYIVSLICL